MLVTEWEGEGERSLFLLFSQNVSTGLRAQGQKVTLPTQNLFPFEAITRTACKELDSSTLMAPAADFFSLYQDPNF